MLIEVHGPEDMLDEIRLFYEDELQNAGYGTGPRIGSIDSGTSANFVKEDKIVSVVTEESETGESALRIEAEQEIPELYVLWDAALISYAKKVVDKIMDFAWDKTRVEKGMK